MWGSDFCSVAWPLLKIKNEGMRSARTNCEKTHFVSLRQDRKEKSQGRKNGEGAPTLESG